MGDSAQTGRTEEQQVPKRSVFSHFTFQSKLARSSQYRPDVDGLRALAVLPVLLFHTDIPGFSGGFVGVDIFYVISGYLITSIVVKDLSRERFSLMSFYDRRIRRIFPALFAMLFVCFLAGYLLLAPTDFTTFGKSLVAITFFMSNIFFKRQGGTEGYFGNASHTQVLLHTWSLSVEEQFYLFFPTTLLLITRYLKDFTKHILWLGVFVSFAINIWATWHAPRAAFYIFIPRAWELLLGALLAVKAVPLLKHRVTRELAGLTGLGLIAWAVVGLTKYTAFPGFAALLPGLGAWLVIYAGESGPSLTKSILSWRPLVFIGVISYSLYLWHWPIIVFTKYVAARPLTRGLKDEQAIAVILFSILIAFLSFEFVESPFRGDSRISRRHIFAFGFAASALSAVLGFSLYLTQGFPGRFDKGTLQLIAMNTDRKKDYEAVPANWRTEIHTMADIKFSYLGDPFTKKIMFLGDSHVQQLYPLIQDIYNHGALHGHGAVFAIAAGCPPAEHLNRIEPAFHCDTFTHFALQRALEDDIDTVFIGFNIPLGFWDLCPSVDGNCVGKISVQEGRRRFFEELADHIQTLKSRGKRVIVSLPFPRFDESVPDLEARNAQLQKLGWARVVTETDSPEVRAQVASTAQSLGIEIFDPRKSLCPQQRCIAQQGGVSIYVDDLHIAASQLGILKDEMVRTLQRAVPPLYSMHTE